MEGKTIVLVVVVVGLSIVFVCTLETVALGQTWVPSRCTSFGRLNWKFGFALCASVHNAVASVSSRLVVAVLQVPLEDRLGPVFLLLCTWILYVLVLDFVALNLRVVFVYLHVQADCPIDSVLVVLAVVAFVGIAVSYLLADVVNCCYYCCLEPLLLSFGLSNLPLNFCCQVSFLLLKI